MLYRFNIQGASRIIGETLSGGREHKKSYQNSLTVLLTIDKR